MLKQLLLCKRLMIEGASFSERSDPVSSGMAISLLQDSVEMLVWALVKLMDIPVKEKDSTFTSNLEALQRKGLTIPLKAKLIELNKARVGFKHYGNLPATEEATKYLAYVEDFLRTTFREHFGVGFDEVSIVDLVVFEGERERMKAAESLMAGKNFEQAAIELAIARSMLFGRLKNFVPEVPRKIEDADSSFSFLSEIRGVGRVSGFKEVANYLNVLREASLASLLRLSLQDYNFIRSDLPAARQMADGRWQPQLGPRTKCDEATCKRAVICLVDIAIRVEGLV